MDLRRLLRTWERFGHLLTGGPDECHRATAQAMASRIIHLCPAAHLDLDAALRHGVIRQG